MFLHSWILVDDYGIHGMLFIDYIVIFPSPMARMIRSAATWQVGAMESSVQEVEKAVEATQPWHHLGSPGITEQCPGRDQLGGIQRQILWTFAVGCGIACGLRVCLSPRVS